MASFHWNTSAATFEDMKTGDACPGMSGFSRLFSAMRYGLSSHPTLHDPAGIDACGIGFHTTLTRRTASRYAIRKLLDGLEYRLVFTKSLLYYCPELVHLRTASSVITAKDPKIKHAALINGRRRVGDA